MAKEYTSDKLLSNEPYDIVQYLDDVPMQFWLAGEYADFLWLRDGDWNEYTIGKLQALKSIVQTRCHSEGVKP